jgi:hypothetical protein
LDAERPRHPRIAVPALPPPPPRLKYFPPPLRRFVESRGSREGNDLKLHFGTFSVIAREKIANLDG